LGSTFLFCPQLGIIPFLVVFVVTRTFERIISMSRKPTVGKRTKEKVFVFPPLEPTYDEVVKQFSTAAEITAAVFGQLLSEEQRIPGQIAALQAQSREATTIRQQKSLDFRIDGLRHRLAYLKSDDYSLPHPGVNCGWNMPGGTDIGAHVSAVFR